MKLSEELRQSVLQAALQGKLTKQSSADGNASELALAIKSEMQERARLKKIKCHKCTPFDEKDVPFDIPKNWKWCKIGEVVIMKAGKSAKSSTIHSNKDEEYKYECFGGNGIRGYKNEYNTEGFHALIGRQGALCGNINFADGKFYATEHAVVVNTFANTDMKFVGIFLKALNLNQYATATAQPGISVTKIANTPFPLPPLEEQHRIVEKVDMLMAEIDELEKKENKLEKLKKEFPEDMKASLLQAAMEGKLTKQMKKDGNMKIKYRSFTKNDFSNSDVPFDIPDNWQWFRHNALLNIVGGSQPPKSHFSNVMKPGYIRLYQTRDYGDKPVPVYINKSEAKKTTNNGDILLARYGGSLGKVFKAKEGAYNVAMAKIVKIHNEVEIDNNFLYYYYMSPIYQNFIKKQSNGRSAQGGFNKKDLDELFFPLPPLAEQHRIVEKLDELLPLCEELEEDKTR